MESEPLPLMNETPECQRSSPATCSAWWRRGWFRKSRRVLYIGGKVRMRTSAAEDRYQANRPRCTKCDCKMSWFWASDFTGWSCDTTGCTSRIAVIKTKCNRCLQPLVCEWQEPCSYAGREVTGRNYMALALQNDSVVIACDSCLSKMRDVKLENLFRE
jgi:hypothetical protein